MSHLRLFSLKKNNECFNFFLFFHQFVIIFNSLSIIKFFLKNKIALLQKVLRKLFVFEV